VGIRRQHTQSPVVFAHSALPAAQAVDLLPNFVFRASHPVKGAIARRETGILTEAQQQQNKRTVDVCKNVREMVRVFSQRHRIGRCASGDDVRKLTSIETQELCARVGDGMRD
jgi:hypothetical protein